MRSRVVRKFEPGFRLSSRDLWVLVFAGGFAFFGLHNPLVDTREFVYVGFYVLLQFFLFCNVFRVPLALELIWASVFVVALMSVHLPLHPNEHLPFWGVLIGTGTAAIAIAMCLPRYHGVLWEKINPRLPERWESELE